MDEVERHDADPDHVDRDRSVDRQRRQSGCPEDPLRVAFVLAVGQHARECEADDGEDDAQVDECCVGFHENSFIGELIKTLDHAAILFGEVG